jgi:predicted dehydrogenase
VNLHCSWLNPRKSRDITVVGDKRMLTFDDMNLAEPIRLYDKQVTDDRTAPSYVDSFASFRASVREGDITIPKVALGEPLKVECDHFLECLENGTQPLSGGREGLAVVRALEALHRSVRNHGKEERL